MINSDLGKTISKNLRRIAYEAGKTQADISRDLKIHKATISSWMNGTRVPKMEKIDLLCHYFNCRRSDILGDVTNNVDTESDSYNNAMKALIESARGCTPEQIRTAIALLNALKEQ